MTPEEIIQSIYNIDEKLSKIIDKLPEAQYDAFIAGNEKLKKYDELLSVPEAITDAKKAFFTPEMFYTVNKYIDEKVKELHIV